MVENTASNPNFLNEKSSTRLLIKNKCAGLKHIWEPYLKLDVLCLPYIYCRHSTEMQYMSGSGIRDCLTEASLGWKCLWKI